MINDINTFQNKYDINLANATEQYLIEALANLGQRYSLKGDGISVKVNTFPQINSTLTNYNINIDVIKVSKSDDEQSVDINLYNLITHTHTLIDSVKINNLQHSATNEQLNVSISELDIFGIENLYMYADTNYFIYSGEIVLENQSKEFICEKYDKYSNKLKSSFRMIPFNYTNNSTNLSYNYIVLYYSKQGENEYYLNLYHINTNNSEELSDNPIHYLTTVILEQSNDNEGEDFSNFSPEMFISEIYESTGTENSFYEHYTVVENDDEPNKYQYPITYNPNNGSYIITNTYNDTLFNNNFKKEIENEQYYQSILYRKLKSRYSDLTYKENTTVNNVSYNTLFNQIIKNLFLYMDNGNAIYIPLDYEFEFTYNTNDPWQIYYSAKDIAVHDIYLINNDEDYTIQTYKDKSGLLRIVNSDNVEKTTFYSFYVEPDPENTSDIYSINVNKHFTMPYISQAGYWVVDDIETSVYARGKDAGNPNITIIESDLANSDTPRILTKASINFFEGLNWITESATLEFPEILIRNGNDIDYQQVKVNNETTFNCNFFIPSLKNISSKKLEDRLEHLKHCIILNVTDVKSVEGYFDNDELQGAINSIYGTNGHIMTFWILDEDTNEPCGYKFTAIKQENGIAIDINYMTNLMNSIGYVLKNYHPADPDNFMFTNVVFDNVNNLTKNLGENKTANYPVFPNIQTVSVSTSDENQTQNNFNLKVSFNDIITGEYYFDDFNSTLPGDDNVNENKSYSYIINGIGQSDRRWFKDWMSYKDVSNNIYSYGVDDENSGITTLTYLEYIPGSINHSVPMVDLSEVFIKDNTSLNRVNVVSFNESGVSYYSYIGTTHLSEDKSIFTIGTSNTNINLGKDTLVDDGELFETQREAHINFDNTRISSYAYVGNDLISCKDTISYGTTWRRVDINNVAYWTTTFRQVGKFNSYNSYYIKLNDDEAFNGMDFTDMSYSFIAVTVPEKYEMSENGVNALPFDMYISDMIFIPNLIHTISPTIEQYDVESDNEVIYYKDILDNISYVGVLTHSTLLKNMFIYPTDPEETIHIDESVSNRIFTSNELEITYYVGENNVAHYTINDLDNSNFMTYIHKIKEYYEEQVIEVPIVNE